MRSPRKMLRVVVIWAVCLHLCAATVQILGGDNLVAYVVEHSSVGTEITELHASDGDGGTPTWTVNDTDFSIGSVGVLSGVLTVASADIDREALPPPHTIPVMVTATIGSESDSIVLSVVVQDINDNPPVFENTNTNSDSISLPEDQELYSVIYTIIASDPDTGNGGNYHFLLSNPDSFFSVNYFTGIVELTNSLDHETNTEHTITIQIRDEGIPQYTTTVTITVTVTDTDEDPPVPHQKHYYGYLAEGTYTFASSPTLATVTSNPGEPNGVVKYTIIDGGQDWIDQFKVGLTTGAVTIDGSFDRETLSRYIVSIRLTEYQSDGVTLSDAPTASTTLILTITDINDNAPQFYSGAYVGFVDEDAQEGHIVISDVNAFDADLGSNAVFEYEIPLRASDFEFQIDRITGVINVTGSFDYEDPNDREFSFTIVAKETEVSNPMQSTASVTVYVRDVNDNVPTLSAPSFQYILTENILESFTPTIIASDLDSSAKFNTLTFELNGIGSQPPYNHFMITTLSTNTVQLSNTVELDKENIDHYHMIITVKDNGTPSLSATADIYVNVTDLNDFAPKFNPESYAVTIDEGLTYSQCVIVSATDTGDVDPINTAIKYSLSVTSASPNTSITGLQNLFTIDSSTGVVTCFPISSSFNYETISLTVVATDTGVNPGPLDDTATITVTVEPNIGKPIVNPSMYTANVTEDAKVGDEIGVKINGTPGNIDSYTHVISYSIIGGNAHGAFAIHANTGVMTVASTLGIDYESIDNPMISVTVQVLETVEELGSQNSATATVTVKVSDVNEFAPEFTSPLGNPVFIVSEGETVLPKVITTAVATDQDGTNNKPIYSIMTPSYGTFEIGETTGILTMTSPPDREAITAADDRFSITLIATDTATNPLSSSVMITIEVTDANDNAPVFNPDMYTISPIPESTGGAVSLLTIEAIDSHDIGVNAEVTYKIESVAPSKPGLVKFQLDSTTGVLQTGPAGFDYEDPTDRMYTIVMVAEDGGTPTMKDTATATITITDVNDNPPHLCDNYLEYTVNEYSGSTLSSTDVTILTGLSCVTDADSSTFKYRIVDTSKTNNWFDVDPNNGAIYIPTGTNIDREHADTIIDKFGRAVFTFEVEVTDSSFTNADYFSDEAEITVYVTDINDNSPVFTVSSIDRTLPEGVPIGTIVDIVSATDADFTTNAVITYSKTSGDTDGLFVVSSDGRISTAASIDKEMIDSAITFVITATDNGGLTDTVNVKVTITDTNDNSPVFSPSFTQVSILEDRPVDDTVAFVYATDADSGINAEITYELSGGNTGNAFKIADSTKGEIKVAKGLDRETTSFYRLVVIAKDGATGSFQRTAVTEVVITLLDVNDNYPVFLYEDHKASVAEDIANNTFVAVSPSIYATDADAAANAVIIYDIQSGFPFTIDHNTGFVYTSYVSVLDRENVDFYNITVYARDSGGLETSGILSITITDVNDHAPVITQSPADLEETISEYAASGTLIGTVLATDNDIGVNSILKYSLTGGDGYFQVDPNTGEVTLSQTIENLERRTPFTVTITVTDGGLPALQDDVSFDVHVTDENDNKPVFKHDDLTYTYPEDTDVSSPILLPVDPAFTSNGVVTDADDGVNQEYSFVLDTTSSPAFDLNSDTGSLYFTSAMDYESQISYTGSIYVVDKGSPPLTSENTVSITLTVTDVNDQPPILDEDVFTANVSEYTSANVPLLLVTATDGDTLDANRVVSFSLTSSVPASGLDLFKINSDTGLLLTKEYLSDTTKGCYQLSIEVINPGTTLKDTGEATICITDQNESPDFDKSFYNFTIFENEPSNTELGYILAFDPDSDPDLVSLTYTLVTEGSDDQLFAINSTTGRLFTLQPLDREDTEVHVLTVIAQDKGNDNFQHTNYTTILVNVLDVNDNNPQLDHSSFNSEYVISENISRNSTIANVMATDPDLNTVNNFRITDDPRSLFKINHQTGHLQTEGGPNDFDRETFSNYTITFEVYNVDDVNKKDTATIFFTLTDVNDNAPFFTTIPNDTCIYENSPNGLDLGTFVCDDVDLGINARVFYQIVGGNTAQAFTIEALTGKLKTQNPLDYEEDPLEYTLTIEVQDLGIPPLSASAEITICLMDTNDNSPSFMNELTEPVVIEEHTKEDYFIAQFNTIDIDSHPFNITELTLVSGNEEGGFRFSSLTRSLYVHNSSVLDYEHVNGTLSYTLTVQAHDVDDPSKVASSSVTVLITDINDHPPYFDKTEFNFTLLEDESVDTILEQVVASDVDSEIVTYTIASGNEDAKFSLDASTGILRLVNSLDYETPPNYYYLIVNVTDGDFYDQAFFHIYIDNINDVSPVIITEPPGLKELEIMLYENLPSGYVLYDVDASDVEGGVLTYLFSDEDVTAGKTDLFSINNETGVVFLTGGLDFEMDVHHEFTVFVRDNGNPPLQDFIHFIVTVLDVNDHLPKFNISSQIIQIDEDHRIGPTASFLTLTATDVDVVDTKANNFYYYLISEDTGYPIDIECGNVFCIERKTGNIYHNRKLDYEVTVSYSTSFVVSNYDNLPANVSVKDSDLDTVQFTINVLDINDNPPVFVSEFSKVAVANDAPFNTLVYLCETTDADSFGNYGKVWYRWLTTFTGPFHLDTESCLVTLSNTTLELDGYNFILPIQAYDNEGEDPSFTATGSFQVFIYDPDEDEAIFKLPNISIITIIDNRQYIQNQLTNITNLTTIITGITESPDDGSISVSFIVVDKNNNTLTENEIHNQFNHQNIVRINEGNETYIVNITVSDPVPVLKEADTIPYWVIIVTIIILGSAIYILCCCLCAFCIVEKRRKRKMKENQEAELYQSTDFSAISKEYASTKNPLWVSPVIMPPKIELESLSGDESIEKPNPVYEEQEINIELFDGLSEDALSIASREELNPPPLSSTTSLTAGSTELLLPLPKDSKSSKPNVVAIPLFKPTAAPIPSSDYRPAPANMQPVPNKPTKPAPFKPSNSSTKPPPPSSTRPLPSVAPAVLKPYDDNLAFSSDEDEPPHEKNLSNKPIVAPAVLKPFDDNNPLTFSSDDDDMPLPQPEPSAGLAPASSKKSRPPPLNIPPVPTSSKDSNEFTMNFMEEFDDEDPPSSSDDGGQEDSDRLLMDQMNRFSTMEPR